ncbi:MAG TPA: aminoacyl-tRNA hydrolase [Candidatus Eisenbacteria bacterium]|nr:aminoacyl-tRNA hydrolase [Candidatus Eisenbacteria bacterium]
MKFIVGIGNPGRQYEGTRHNAGFAVLDRLADDCPPGTRLVRPGTFVNRTGDAVLELRSRHGAAESDVLVVCDDVNLDFGKLRLRPDGSAGGHHGLESVIEALGSDGFPRLRIGVRNALMPQDLAGFVLEKFSAEEAKTIGGIVEKAAQICRTWAREGFEAAQNRLSQLQSVKQENKE